MRIPYGRVQGSGYNACTGKYCIICPGGKKKNLKLNLKNPNALTFHSMGDSQETWNFIEKPVFLPRRTMAHNDSVACQRFACSSEIWWLIRHLVAHQRFGGSSEIWWLIIDLAAHQRFGNSSEIWSLSEIGGFIRDSLAHQRFSGSS
jgi:hypothetical protein